MNGIPLTTIESWLREEGSLLGDSIVVGTPTQGEIRGVCVDSRLAGPGCLFVSLQGDRVDGHDYVDQAVQRGAVAALVQSARLSEVQSRVFGSVRILPVADPLHALQTVALRWRLGFPDLTRIGVTGSNGKTTTKELISNILSQEAPTVWSAGNYNSDIGLPMELLKIRSNHRFGVFEMGMNRTGEIELLAGLVEPDIAVITNIGTAHIGMLGSQDAILREKKMIFSRFTGLQTAVIPDDSSFADELADSIEGKVVRYNRETAGVVEVRENGLDGTILVTSEGEITYSLPGPQMVQNALAAMTVARILDIPFDRIVSGLERSAAVPGRSQILPGGITIIHDAYNANPESMVSAFGLLQSAVAPGRRIAILGAMKELGSDSDSAHQLIAQKVQEYRFDEVWLVGDEYQTQGLNGVRTFSDDQWSELVELVKGLQSGDVVMLKGSRSAELERLIPIIQGEVA